MFSTFRLWLHDVIEYGDEDLIEITASLVTAVKELNLNSYFRLFMGILERDDRVARRLRFPGNLMLAQIYIVGRLNRGQ